LGQTNQLSSHPRGSVSQAKPVLVIGDRQARQARGSANQESNIALREGGIFAWVTEDLSPKSVTGKMTIVTGWSMRRCNNLVIQEKQARQAKGLAKRGFNIATRASGGGARAK